MRTPPRKLAKINLSNEKSSQAVYLLSHVAPAIQSLTVNLSTVSYSHKEKLMRINVQVDSFNIVEKLRTDIINRGLFAKFLSSNVIDEKFQAHLRISAREKSCCLSIRFRKIGMSVQIQKKIFYY